MARRQNNVALVAPSLRPWYDYQDRLSREPTPETIRLLDSLMDMAYGTSQINTHVRTGALRASGHLYTEHRRTPRRNIYEGIISMGDGLDYDQYEMGARRRGVREDWLVHPSHDPYDGLEIYYAGVDAVLRAIGRI